MRLRLWLRVARFDARARCSGVVHVGCAGRRFGSTAAWRGAACAVHEPCSRFKALGAHASRRSRAALGVLGASVAGKEAAARCGASDARRRGAPGGGGQRGGSSDFRGSSEADSRARCRRLFRLFTGTRGVCRCVLRGARVGAAWVERGARRAAASEQSCKLTSASAPVQLLHDGLRERRGGSVARVGCLLCRVRCAVTPSAGCARADATRRNRRSAAPLRQPRRAQPRRRHGHELTCTRRCTSGKRARRCRCSAPGGSRPGGAGRPLHGHFSRYTTVSTTRLVISAGTLLCRRHSWSLQPVHYCVDDTVPHLPASRHDHRHTTCWLCVGDTGHTNAVPRHRL